MAALTANKTRLIRETHTRHTNVMSMLSSPGINYVGAIVYVDSVTNILTQSGAAGANLVAGISANYAADATADVAQNCEIEFGHVERFTLAAGVPKVGDSVYATNNADLTLTAAAASKVGVIFNVISATIIDVHITGAAL